jgi:hypothetical protein
MNIRGFHYEVVDAAGRVTNVMMTSYRAKNGFFLIKTQKSVLFPQVVYINAVPYMGELPSLIGGVAARPRAVMLARCIGRRWQGWILQWHWWVSARPAQVVGAFNTGSFTNDDYNAVSASLSPEVDADSGAKSLLQELEGLTDSDSAVSETLDWEQQQLYVNASGITELLVSVSLQSIW